MRACGVTPFPPFLCSLEGFPQIDHGADYEPEGDGIQMLLSTVTSSTCTPVFHVPSFLLSDRFHIITIQTFTNQRAYGHPHCGRISRLDISVNMYYIEREFAK